MIQLIESATERTTAVTDLVLAVEFVLFAALFIKSTSDNKRAAAWSIPFLLLAGAFLIGAFAHGFQMSEKTNLLLWLFLAAFSAFASLVQLISSIHFTIIWEFDSNGAFHLIQMLAGIFLGLGIIGVMKIKNRHTV